MPSDFALPRSLSQALLLVALSACLGLAHNALQDGPSLLFSQKTDNAEEAPEGQVRTLGALEAMALHASGAALFIDAREALDYLDGHVPGAANLPVENLPAAGGPVPLVVYCSDTACGRAEELAGRLAARGFKVRVMPDGMSGWAAAQGPVEMAQ
jgi:rhodanese-related sulfurtransferase